MKRRHSQTGSLTMLQIHMYHGSMHVCTHNRASRQVRTYSPPKLRTAQYYSGDPIRGRSGRAGNPA
jgi:hypothetical protein